MYSKKQDSWYLYVIKYHMVCFLLIILQNSSLLLWLVRITACQYFTIGLGVISHDARTIKCGGYLQIDRVSSTFLRGVELPEVVTHVSLASIVLHSLSSGCFHVLVHFFFVWGAKRSPDTKPKARDYSNFKGGR